MPVTFPRTQAPMEQQWPRGRSPISVEAQNSRINVRNSLQVGWTWEEEWPPMDGRGADLLAELAIQAEEWHRSGERVLVRPWLHRNTRSTIAAGSTGSVSGAGQSGTTLNVTGFTANATLRRRDYFTIVGLPYHVNIMADVTLDGSGAGAVTIGPPIFVGPAQPADAAVITLNGLLDCFIVKPPDMPQTFNGTEWVSGLRIEFTEAVPSIVLGQL